MFDWLFFIQIMIAAMAFIFAVGLSFLAIAAIATKVFEWLDRKK